MAATASIQVRRWRTEDVEPLVRYANNRNIWRHLMDRMPYPYTRADAENWIALNERPGEETLHFAIDLEGEAIGAIGFKRFDDVHRLTVEVGYWLGEPFWGRGVATAALLWATAYAFKTLGAARIQAMVFEDNIASAHVLEKAGYTLEGRLRRSIVKDGCILDSLLYSRISDSAQSKIQPGFRG